MIVATIRVVAQKIRHAPGLRRCASVWDLIRPSYLRLLKSLGRGQGVSVRLAGHPVKLDPRFATQSWEATETESYRAFVSEIHSGDVVYDVGAQLGTYAILAVQCSAPNGRAVAYEPMDGSRKFLNLHLRLNQVENQVIVRSFCCGSQAGTARLYHDAGKIDGDCSLVPRTGSEHSDVKLVTLDSEVSELGLIPSVIKIDVEGWEWEVLKGARRTLERYRPCLLLSLHPPALTELGVSDGAVLSWLEELGYKWQTIARDHEVHVLAKWAGERCG